eukprot:gene14446-biopygen23122
MRSCPQKALPFGLPPPPAHIDQRRARPKSTPGREFTPAAGSVVGASLRGHHLRRSCRGRRLRIVRRRAAQFKTLSLLYGVGKVLYGPSTGYFVKRVHRNLSCPCWASNLELHDIQGVRGPLFYSRGSTEEHHTGEYGQLVLSLALGQLPLPPPPRPRLRAAVGR